VQTEPNSVALSPSGTRAYVANTVSGTVTILNVTPSPFSTSVIVHLAVGTEPYGLALTPNGTKLYVTNARSNTVSVIDTSSNLVVRTIANVGFEPRGIAITNDGDAIDTDETVLVTQFLALPVSGKLDGEDDGKEAFVTRISASSDVVLGMARLAPLADTGFKAAGDALARRAPPAAPTAADFTFTTGAYPNQLNGIAIRGGCAYVPNTGASPNGPVRFDVNTQSLISAFNFTTSLEVAAPLNLNLAVQNQTGTPKLFPSQPWAIAFKTNADQGYVVSAASNVVTKISLNSSTGAPAVVMDPADPSRTLQIRVGRGPRGIVINADNTRAYVGNYFSRDISVIDLTASPERVMATPRSADPPATGSLAERIHIGNELYHTSIGEFDPLTAGGPAIIGRMSNNGWGACSSCHPDGLSDNVVWIFGAGPRRTISQHQDFDRTNLTRQRALNWSGIFDEIEDFEANIRGTSGGLGLLVNSDGTPGAIGAFTPASGGRIQIKVRGVNSWDALKAYIQSIRAPLSPVSKTSSTVVAGRSHFITANCQSCHGGPLWTNSRVFHTAPAPGGLLSSGQLIDQLRKVGSFDSNIRTEIRANATAPLGADGYVPPSLISVFAATRTYWHNGTALSLDAVLENVTHRAAGTGGIDTLTDAGRRAELAAFVSSIDANSEPIAPPVIATRIFSSGIVHAASFAGAPNPASPGALGSAFGENMAKGRLLADSLPLPTNLDGTQVIVNNLPAPLLFISPGQINFQIPFETAAGAPINVVVKVPDQPDSPAESLSVQATAPGLFTVNSSGTGAGVITHADYSLVGNTAPAADNEVVIAFVTGLGQTETPGTTGAAATASRAVAAVTATVGGRAAEVQWAGTSPGYAGLYQVNFVIPAGLAAGDHDVILTAGGRSSRAGVTVRKQ